MTADAAVRGGSPTKPLDERLEELYSAHAARALRLAFLLTGDRDAAEDICQEAFARVGGKLGGLRDPERAAGYLLRTVANLSRGHGRTLRRARLLERRLPGAGEAEHPDASSRDEIVRALLSLPQRQRAAVFLRFFEDLSERDSAEALGCTVGALRSLTFRALEDLRERLREVGT